MKESPAAAAPPLSLPASQSSTPAQLQPGPNPAVQPAALPVPSQSLSAFPDRSSPQQSSSPAQQEFALKPSASGSPSNRIFPSPKTQPPPPPIATQNRVPHPSSAWVGF